MSALTHSSFANVAAVVLPAGSSACGQQYKQLRGETLLGHAIRRVQALRCGRVGVLLNARQDDVIPEIEDTAIAILLNDAWHPGLGTTVKVASQWAALRRFDALLIVPADQSAVPSTHLLALLRVWRKTRVNVGSRYAGSVGVPAVFDARSFGDLRALAHDDAGARTLLSRPNALGIDCAAAALDVGNAAELAPYSDTF